VIFGGLFRLWLRLWLIFKSKFFIENPGILVQLSLRVLLIWTLFVMLGELTLALFFGNFLCLSMGSFSLFRMILFNSLWSWLIIKPVIIVSLYFPIS
jgi:hypothetical protein